MRSSGESQVVTIYKEIGKMWKVILMKIETAQMINQIIHEQFEKNTGYKYYIKTDVIKGKRLEYD